MIKVNGVEIKFELFPNGEKRISQESAEFLKVQFYAEVSFKYEDDSSLIELVILKGYIDDFNFNNSLIIYYMPYSRMDRSENNSPFSLKYIANLINYLDFDEVSVIEPHSDVTSALLNKSQSLYVNNVLLPAVKEEVQFVDGQDYIVFPDLGASKRYSNMKENNVLIGHKVRDFKTGAIEGLKIIGDVSDNIHPKKAIIVDDLSSYGGTFIATASELKSLGINEIYLLVAHAENSVFKGDLFNHIDMLFTTNSIVSEEGNWENIKYQNKIHIFQLEDVIKKYHYTNLKGEK